VDAFLRAGADEACNGQVLNVGGLEPVAHRDLVQLLIRVAGSGRYRFVDWPAEKKAIDIGDFYADSTRIKQTLGWTPRTGLADGLRETIGFYREHFDQYVPAAASASPS
jgi:UDP-glucose 4-epimerase